MNEFGIKKIDHFVITTSNADACFEFYRKIGFDVHVFNNRGEMFAGDFKINVHYLGEELQPHAKNIRVGSADFCFEILESIESFKEQLIQESIELLEDNVVRQGVKGVMKSLYIRDPDGNLLEFSKYE